MTKVIKTPETFQKAKLIRSIKKAGATPAVAAKIGAMIAKKVSKKSKVKSVLLRKMVINALNKVSKGLARRFRKYKKR